MDFRPLRVLNIGQATDAQVAVRGPFAEVIHFTGRSVPWRGEALSLNARFVFGDLEKTLRLWTLANEKNPSVISFVKKVVSEHLPYDQEISPILEGCKEFSSTYSVGLLISDGKSFYVFLPPGFAVYRLNSKTSKVDRLGGDKALVLRSPYPRSHPGYGLIMTSEHSRIGSRDVSEIIIRGCHADDLTAQDMLERIPVDGPIGFLSMESLAQLGQRNLTLVHVKSNRGLVRELNEDCGVAVSVNYVSNGISSRFALTGVADGVGGLDSGEVASKIGISIGTGEVMHQVLVGGKDDRSRVFESAFESASQKIADFETYGKKSMASTLSMTVVTDGVVYTGSAGDTRTYLTRFKDGSIERLTTDHRLSQEGAQSHVITRALGARDHTPEVCGPFYLRTGDAMVTCSDGLHDLVSDAEIAEASTLSGNPKATCSKLIALANSRGGKDNITAAALTWSRSFHS